MVKLAYNNRWTSFLVLVITASVLKVSVLFVLVPLPANVQKKSLSYLNQCGTSKNRCHQTDFRNAVRTFTEHPGAKLFCLSSPVTNQSPNSRVRPPSLTKPRTEKKAPQLPNLHLLSPLRQPATHRLRTACRPLLLVPTHLLNG